MRTGKDPGQEDGMKGKIVFNIDVMMARKKMTVTELADKVGITVSNMSNLKNGKAKSLKLSTLEKLCEALECQPGDLLEFVEEAEDNTDWSVWSFGDR